MLSIPLDFYGVKAKAKDGRIKTGWLQVGFEAGSPAQSFLVRAFSEALIS